MDTIDYNRCPCCGTTDHITKDILCKDNSSVKMQLCLKCGILYMDVEELKNLQKDFLK